MPLVLSTLLAHYRRHPFQAVFLLLGMVIGSGLLTGIHAVNQRARDSYTQSSELFNRQEAYRVLPVQSGGSVPDALYAALRRQGIDTAVPLIRLRHTLPSGQRIQVLGIDPLAATAAPDGSGSRLPGGLGFATFSRPPFAALIDRSEARRLGLEDGQPVTLGPGLTLGQLRVVERTGAGAGQWVMDMAAARQLSGASGLNAVSIQSLDPDQRRWLEQRLPASLRLLEVNDAEDLDRLTRSFHLNLTAMGLLSFVVGLFIVYNAVSFALIQRRPTVARLRQLGVSRAQIVRALTTELALFVVVATLLGFALGLVLADRLAPPVNDTLQALYEAPAAISAGFDLLWLLEAGAMTLAGCLLACGQRFVQLTRTPPSYGEKPQAERQWRQGDLRLQRGLFLVLATLSLVLFVRGGGLGTGFLVLAGVLLCAALALPSLLLLALAVLRPALRHWPLAAWLRADAEFRLGRLSVAMMAFLLAIAANAGINTMVGSFRGTFLDWLDHRLQADLYLRPPADRATAVRDKLRGLAEVEAVHSYRQAAQRIEARPGEVIGLDPEVLLSTHPLKQGLPDLDRRLAEGEVLVNEQLALHHGLKPGDRVSFGDGPARHTRRIAGIYHDYGNPRPQVAMTSAHWLQRWPGVPPLSLSVFWRPGQALESAEVERLLDLPLGSTIDQASVKSLSRRIFERTFAVTTAMNGLTLLVASIGLFCALLAAESARLRQLGVLQSLGVSPLRLWMAGLAQVGAITLLTAALAIPLGIVLAWMLIHVINVQAFGWSFPLRLFPVEYLRLAAFSLLAALVAASVPAWQQTRSACRRWLQEAAL